MSLPKIDPKTQCRNGSDRSGTFYFLRLLDPSIKLGPFDWEVYDLSKDRSETTDLSASRRDIIAAAIAVLKKEYSCAAGFPELNIFAPESGRKDPAILPKPVPLPESAVRANP